MGRHSPRSNPANKEITKTAYPIIYPPFTTDCTLEERAGFGE